MERVAYLRKRLDRHPRRVFFTGLPHGYDGHPVHRTQRALLRREIRS
jgi:hypothetical protein